MAFYKIEWRESAIKELRRLEKNTITRILEKTAALERDPLPVNCRKLQGSDHTYRIRIGDYRVVYTVENDVLVIEIVRVAHRKDVYR